MSQPEKDKREEVAQGPSKVETQIPVQCSAVSETAMGVKKAVVIARITSLLERGPLDEIDKTTIEAAVAFIENPSENLAEIQKHTIRIGEVAAGYMMQGENAPAEIDDLEAYLFSLQCMNRIKFIEEEMSRAVIINPSEITEAITLALDWATTLSKGYNDSSMLDEVQALLLRLEKL